MLPGRPRRLERVDKALGVLGFVLSRVMQRRDVKVEEAGEQQVNGHPTTKYRVTIEGQPGELDVYAAKDLKNLIVKIDGQFEGHTVQVELTNISLDVPDSAFSPPAGYEKTYTKVDVSALQPM